MSQAAYKLAKLRNLVAHRLSARSWLPRWWPETWRAWAEDLEWVIECVYERDELIADAAVVIELVLERVFEHDGSDPDDCQECYLHVRATKVLAQLRGATP